MSSKVAIYLKEHINGEVLDSASIRKRFSTDGSILTLTPQLVAFVRNTNDIRKIARFSWQLAEKKHLLPITVRGFGSDVSGGALGDGVIIQTVAHMNRILELDTKQRLVRVQPGVSIRSLQETLYTHGFYLPAADETESRATIGGLIANNSTSRNTSDGSIARWVDRLEVVLANGEVIQTGKISKKELEKRKGLPTLEGELYRAVDGAINDYDESLSSYWRQLGSVANDGIGYNLRDVRGRDGTFNLTPLFVGSQGTLGIISEVIMKIKHYEPATQLVVAGFDSVEKATQAAEGCRSLNPRSLEFINGALMEFIGKKRSTNLLSDVFPDAKKMPAAILYMEFPRLSKSRKLLNKGARQAIKILNSSSSQVASTTDAQRQDDWWALRNSVSEIIAYESAGKSALPFIHDSVVPKSSLSKFIIEAENLLKKHGVLAALWGSVADGNIHTMPLLDLSKVGDRQKIVKLMNDYYSLVWKMGGTIAGGNGDGRLKAAYAEKQVGSEVMEAYRSIKKSFDPYGTLNPGVKIDVDAKSLVKILRKSYIAADSLDYLPVS